MDEEQATISAGPLPQAQDRRIAGSLLCERYEILNEVGRGGMGVVYRGRHRELDKPVAIKVNHPGVSAERFRREARLLGRIQSPFVVTVHDFDVLPDGSPMLVMEWIEGKSLHAVIQSSNGPLSEEQVKGWMVDVCQGMLAAAAHDIVHRDLKPANILLDQSGSARVADFGLARTLHSEVEMTSPGMIMGSPHYIAPEQTEDSARVDTRADIYSFGCTFYHAVTGMTPFSGDSALDLVFRHRTEPLVSPRSRNPAISDRMNDILERCMAKSRNHRYSSFREVLRDLTGEVHHSASPWLSRTDQHSARHWDRYSTLRPRYLDPAPGETSNDLYEIQPGRTLRILHGSITEQETDALVSCDDDGLTMMGGVACAIRKAGGVEIFQELRRYVLVNPGRAVVTSAGRLPARYVFHGITLGHRNSSVRPSRDLIIQILTSCFYHAVSLSIRSISLPLLATGTGNFSREVCLDTMFTFLVKELDSGTTQLEDVRIVIFVPPATPNSAPRFPPHR